MYALSGLGGIGRSHLNYHNDGFWMFSVLKNTKKDGNTVVSQLRRDWIGAAVRL